MTNPKTVKKITPELTRGYKKKERTRRKLVEAALNLLGTKDIGEFTLLGLAEEAEMSNGTVYNYFATKEEVLDAVTIELADRFSGSISILSMSTESGAARVSFGIRMYIKRSQEDLQWAKAVVRLSNFNSALNSAVASFILADIQAGIAQGSFDIKNSHLAMNMVVASGIMAMRTVIEGNATVTLGEDVAFLVLRALGLNTREAKKMASLPLPTPELSEDTKKPAATRGRPKK